MIKNNRLLIFSLLFPIFSLGSIVIYKSIGLHSNKEVVLPIKGYDPRDLLSGHFLRYTIDYGITEICPSSFSNSATIYVCLDHKKVLDALPVDCTIFIKGTCRHRSFEAGIEKFFIPEDKAISLDKKIRAGTGKILVSLKPDGTAQIKDLLINGISWKEQ